MITQIKHIKKKVIELLTKHPHLRDSDNKLIATIWNRETGVVDNGFLSKETTAFDFLEAFAEGQYTSPESIRRCRQKVQEDIPELRGTSYKNRKIAGEEFKNEIFTV